jgi:predicted Zn-ribbon and HTH transcriptional regulator
MSPSTEAATTEAGKRWEVADIFREFGTAYRHENSVPYDQRKVMHSIAVCRTSYLGGHVEKCQKCGFEQHAYNSCRNRHCPKCQCLTKAKWLEDRKTELLPVPYFHNVFTLPHELNPVALSNRKAIYSILFKAVSETLLQFGRNNLGGTIGFTAILHTWDQRLLDHIHLHCVIPGGALSPDKTKWIPSAENYLFNVQALSMVFRGKFIEHLGKAHAKGKLEFPGTIAKYATPEGFSGLIRDLRAKDWVVFSKKPFAGPKQVLDYIGRYTHRVAISNNRIVDVQDGMVTFTYRDRKDNNTLKLTTVDSEEFIKRFLLHVLPAGFMKIRHFGLLANKSKKQTIQLCRDLIGDNIQYPERQKKTSTELMIELTGKDITKCPCCKEGTMITIMEMPYPSIRSAYSYTHNGYTDSS